MPEMDKTMERAGTSRRGAIKGLVGVGVAAWSVPTLQIISMSAAHADSTSGPPPPPPTESTSTPTTPSSPATTETTVKGTEATRPRPGGETSSATVAGTEASRPRGGALPSTGMPDGLLAAGVAGIAAVGIGTEVVRRSRQTADERDLD